MNARAALPCRTGGARQQGGSQLAAVAAASALWIHTSVEPFPSCTTNLTDDPIDPASLSPFGDAESPKVARKEASQ
jgi:hypothetical protein